MTERGTSSTFDCDDPKPPTKSWHWKQWLTVVVVSAVAGVLGGIAVIAFNGAAVDREYRYASICEAMDIGPYQAFDLVPAGFEQKETSNATQVDEQQEEVNGSCMYYYDDSVIVNVSIMVAPTTEDAEADFEAGERYIAEQAGWEPDLLAGPRSWDNSLVVTVATDLVTKLVVYAQDANLSVEIEVNDTSRPDETGRGEPMGAAGLLALCTNSINDIAAQLES